MYIHAGNNRMIRTKSIIGVFDMDTATMAGTTRDFLRAAEREGRLVNIREDIPKSFVVCCERGKKTVYLSQMASATLLRRAESGML